MKKPEYEKLPREFRADYAKFAAVRLALSAVVLAAAAFGCAILDFSGMKYPAMGRVLLAGAAIAADCVLLGLHRFLRPSWEGTVLSVGAGYKLKAAGEKGKPTKRIIVELEIDRETRSRIFRSFTGRINTPSETSTSTSIRPRLRTRRAIPSCICAERRSPRGTA